jgi:predicted dehydrogenase
MDIAGIREVLHRQPFQPFSIRLADGRSLAVKHRDFVALGTRRRLSSRCWWFRSIYRQILKAATVLIRVAVNAGSKRRINLASLAAFRYNSVRVARVLRSCALDAVPPSQSHPVRDSSMRPPLDRRSFLKTASLGAGALSAGVLGAPGILHAANRKEKINCVIVGCGGRGTAHLSAIKNENLVAIVDVDDNHFAKYLNLRAKHGDEQSNVQKFTDYRQMFDKIHKQIDAVFVATPNHHHAPVSMIAMQLGKGVYCEKPLCHDVSEARRVREMAAKYKVATQMGNQGHCAEGYRRLCEYVWAGTIGQIRETHSWCDRSNGGVGPRPPTLPVPTGMHWDNWIGPAPYRDFHSDLHPHEWHGWYDFGNGSLGNMACHVLDGVFWSLKLEHPTSFEMESVAGGTDERYPTGTRIRWDFPARGDLAPVKVYWYDGYVASSGDDATLRKRTHYLPPLLLELKQKYPKQEFDSNGTLYVGEKGILYTATYGADMTLLPHEMMQEVPAPPRTLPRPKGSFADFIRAVKAGKTDTATSFDYGSRLTEFILLGNLAQRAGVGKKVEWDGPNMRSTNLSDLNRFTNREYRKGWDRWEV